MNGNVSRNRGFRNDKRVHAVTATNFMNDKRFGKHDSQITFEKEKRQINPIIITAKTNDYTDYMDSRFTQNRMQYKNPVTTTEMDAITSAQAHSDTQKVLKLRQKSTDTKPQF